jgi:endonuclease/exonuclease/phosphatase (EEP) superfamily protein YafD
MHMSFEIKAVQWNIGGAKILQDGADPASPEAYTEDGLDHIIDVIKQESPDLVTLQEAHQRLPFEIAHDLGYEGWVNHPVSPSHIDKREMLALGCVSKGYIYHDSLSPLTTPPWSMQIAEGVYVSPHKKAIANYLVGIDGGDTLAVQNLHLFPFRKLGVDSSSAKAEPVLREVEEKVGTWESPRLLQGDFNLNYESLRPLLPGLFEAGFEEVEQHEITTPRNSRPDHVLYSGMTVVRSTVIKDVLTDHYPIVTTFQFGMADVLPFIRRQPQSLGV